MLLFVAILRFVESYLSLCLSVSSLERNVSDKDGIRDFPERRKKRGSNDINVGGGRRRSDVLNLEIYSPADKTSGRLLINRTSALYVGRTIHETFRGRRLLTR